MNESDLNLLDELISKTNDDVSKLSENLYKPDDPDVLRNDIRNETPEEREERHERNDYTPEYNAAIQRINDVGESFYGRTEAKGFKLAKELAAGDFLSKEAKEFINDAISERNSIEHSVKDVENECRKIVGHEAYEQTKILADEIEKISKEVLGTVGSIDNLVN
ncbi:MAG: hypothetical protein IKP49_12380 [Treponema sp.]|nr:hypothetical protein [Treponema sp.]MCR5124224.1 hypothetical protein [Treponema sp.]